MFFFLVKDPRDWGVYDLHDIPMFISARTGGLLVQFVFRQPVG